MKKAELNDLSQSLNKCRQIFLHRADHCDPTDEGKDNPREEDDLPKEQTGSSALNVVNKWFKKLAGEKD